MRCILLLAALAQISVHPGWALLIAGNGSDDAESPAVSADGDLVLEQT